jgi:adenylate cyclase
MQRRLTAILSADVAGYSGLMEVDEAGTLERLKVNRSRIFDPFVAAQGGRVVKLMGDGALVEFGSVVAAVNCALAIQEATARAESEHAGAKGIRYRIGINLGDVIVEGDDIYGEGVNVAARLQALAPVGGVAVSLTVRDQVAGKASCTFEDLGEHTVKNLERPVRAFAVHTTGREQHKTQSPPHRLSVCVCRSPT